MTQFTKTQIHILFIFILRTSLASQYQWGINHVYILKRVKRTRVRESLQTHYKEKRYDTTFNTQLTRKEDFNVLACACRQFKGTNKVSIIDWAYKGSQVRVQLIPTASPKKVSIRVRGGFSFSTREQTSCMMVKKVSACVYAHLGHLGPKTIFQDIDYQQRARSHLRLYAARFLNKVYKAPSPFVDEQRDEAPSRGRLSSSHFTVFLL